MKKGIRKREKKGRKRRNKYKSNENKRIEWTGRKKGEREER